MVIAALPISTYVTVGYTQSLEHSINTDGLTESLT